MRKSKNRTSVASVTISRRKFLQRSAGVTFVIGSTGIITACSSDSGSPADSPAVNAPSMDANIWVTINPDDSIRIMYGGTEMGQGSMTTTPLILAEHLDADWANVQVETVAIHDTAYGNPVFGNMLYTAGSTTVMAYFDKMVLAGTQARRMLLNAAGEHWGVAADELTTEPSVVVHSPSGRKMTYGEVVSLGHFPDEPPAIDASEIKSKDEYRYLGMDYQRIDVPSKVNGSAEYGMDVQVEGMAYAAVRRAPVEGDKPLDVDDSETRKVVGVTDVVVLPYGVAVVGETVEATVRGKAKLQVRWSEESRFREADTGKQIDHYAAKARDLDIEGTTWSEAGDVRTALANASTLIDATYTSEPAYHAQMEPMNTTASVSEDGKSAEIWVGTQTQSLSLLGAAQLLETSHEKITLHPLTLGGGYGRRSPFRQQYIDDALLVSRELKRPIKVIWSREDDIEAGVFRTAASQYLRAGFDAGGKLSGIHHRVAAPTVLESMNPMRWSMADGKDVITMFGSENTTYDIPNHLAEHVMLDRQSRVCAWRGVGTSYTKFAIESFLDEIAKLGDIDPLQFRLQLCHKNPRMLAVLQNVADMAEWSSPRDSGRALGIAVSSYHKSLSAGIVELSLNEKSGEIFVHKFWVVGDPGFVVSPGNSEAQVEGNIVFGLSAALKERITLTGGVVQQSNFHDYPIMRMAEVPEINVRVLSTDNPSTGVGELGLAMVGPAIANAISSLTGARIRHMPFTREKVLQALDARA